MPTRNVNLTEHFDRFIETADHVRPASAMRAKWCARACALLEQRGREDKAKLQWLRAAAKEGFDSIDRGRGLSSLKPWTIWKTTSIRWGSKSPLR